MNWEDFEILAHTPVPKLSPRYHFHTRLSRLRDSAWPYHIFKAGDGAADTHIPESILVSGTKAIKLKVKY